MATISIDYNSSQNEIYLLGDICALRNNRFAWRYFKDYLHVKESEGKYIISIDDNEPITLLTAISSALDKYGFQGDTSDSSEKLLMDFSQEEKNFKEFSQKALDIRNGICDYNDFEAFKNSVQEHLTSRTLYKLQLLAAYHLAFSQNACDFSVPGAGKTSIVYGAYAYLHYLPTTDVKYVERLLIIGPLSSFGPWESEYEECFGRRPTVMRLIGGVSKDEKQSYLYSQYPAELTLISYNSVPSLQDDLSYFLRNNKVMVVLDEAHKIKNASNGVIAPAVLSLSRYCKSRVALTGTPAPNGYEDLYNIFKFIWPTRNVIHFTVNQLCDITKKGDSNRVDRLINNIAPYYVRIKKSDLNIPAATVHDPIYVQMGPYQQRIYDYIEDQYMDAIIDEKNIDSSSRFKSLLTRARLTRLMQAATNPSMLKDPIEEFIDDEDCPREAYSLIDDSEIVKAIIDYDNIETPPKYIEARELIEQIISSGGKVVVWANFIHTILGLKDYLGKFGIKSQEIYGAIPVKQDDEEEEENSILTRERIVEDFQKPDCPYKVLIANPNAVAESISLHKACHNAIYIERSFNAAHFVQSKDRIHRYGLPEGTETNYYFIVSQGTIDETINCRLAEKEKRMIDIMESMPIPLFDNATEDLGDEDIKALIKDYVNRKRRSKET